MLDGLGAWGDSGNSRHGYECYNDPESDGQLRWFWEAIRAASDWKLGKSGLAEGGAGHRPRGIRNGWMGSRAEQRVWNGFWRRREGEEKG